MEKRIRNLEDNYLKMQQTQDQILKEVQDLKKQTITKKELDLSNELLCKRLFLEADKRYASKIAERVIYVSAGTIISYVLYSLLDLI
jgi:Mg2+ and Co2+ transporter CorA